MAATLQHSLGDFGVSDDLPEVAKCEKDVQQAGGAHISAARPQPYYLDMNASSGQQRRGCARVVETTEHSVAEIATIGDLPNDVLMFEKSGVSIAMGNASPEVQDIGDVCHFHERGRRVRQSD